MRFPSLCLSYILHYVLPNLHPLFPFVLSLLLVFHSLYPHLSILLCFHVLFFLTNEDIKNGKLTAAKERMGKEGGGLDRHSVECTRGIDWENARIVGVENRLRQRQVREGIESLRTIHNRKKVLNSFESLMPWRPLLDKYFDRDNVNTRMRLF